MAKLSIVAGTTSQSVNVFIQDSSSTTGAGLAALVFNTTNLIAYYTFTGTNAGSVAITLATLAAVNSAFSSGGFKEIDATNMKGLYRLDIPNAALAASKGRAVTLILSGAANMAPCVLEIELTGWDNQDGVRGGMTALPNAAAGANSGLLTCTTGNVLPANAIVDASFAAGTGKKVIRANTAAAGAAGSITLDAGASATDSIYNDCWVYLTGGTGAGQTRLITGYTGSTQVALVAPNWQTNPDATSTFAILPAGRVDLSHILGTLSPAAAGSVGIDWGQVSNKGSTVNLSATTVNLVNTLTTYTGNTVQTGDSFARLGAPAGASIAADLAEIEGETDGIAAIPTSSPSAAAIATAVWTDTTAGDFATASSPGKILVTQLGGTFTTNASSIFTVAALANGPSGSGASAATIATTVWQDLTASADFSTVGSIGALLSRFAFSVANQVNANVKSVNQAGVKGTGVSGDEWGPA